ncbi:MAG: saccharopine dehydrogenase NADP-binding domain-containing protein [Bacteroidia bacterium]|nr:saccharopine dehydrogenase NADP-binding domain-containing protein [Bacteroidia bacterium]MDW8088594.1 saccharopine dehydrogenase NADP-binding domain-containing protein [Bacteroidia bacterium]
MWLLYGANGTTGRLVLRVWRAHFPDLPPPLLGGRRETELRALAQAYGLSYQAFPLTTLQNLELPKEIRLIANLAGPYRYTSEPWLKYCLQQGRDYLDICGEWPVFAQLYAAAEEYAQKGLAVITGAGYDTVAGETALTLFRARYPQAQDLRLAIYAEGGFSAGTARAALGVLSAGEVYWQEGQLQPGPTQTCQYRLPDGRTRTFRSAPLAELITYPAWNPELRTLRTYVGLPPKLQRWQGVVQWLSKQAIVQALIGWLLEQYRTTLADRMTLTGRAYAIADSIGAPAYGVFESPQPYWATAWLVLRSLQLYLKEGAAAGVASAFARWQKALWEGLPTQIHWQPKTTPQG